jgi:hypothetical protein
VGTTHPASPLMLLLATGNAGRRAYRCKQQRDPREPSSNIADKLESPLMHLAVEQIHLHKDSAQALALKAAKEANRKFYLDVQSLRRTILIGEQK